MSHIVDALIFESMADRDAIQALNADLASRDERSQQFLRLETDMAGGSKFFCGTIWASAFNYVLSTTIEDCFARAPWQWPDRVVLIVDPYDDEADPRSATATELRALRAGGSDAPVMQADLKPTSGAK